MKVLSHQFCEIYLVNRVIMWFGSGRSRCVTVQYTPSPSTTTNRNPVINRFPHEDQCCSAVQNHHCGIKSVKAKALTSMASVCKVKISCNKNSIVFYGAIALFMAYYPNHRYFITRWLRGNVGNILTQCRHWQNWVTSGIICVQPSICKMGSGNKKSRNISENGDIAITWSGKIGEWIGQSLQPHFIFYIHTKMKNLTSRIHFPSEKSVS